MTSLRLLGSGALLCALAACSDASSTNSSGGASTDAATPTPTQPTAGPLKMAFESEPYACIDTCPKPRHVLSTSEIHLVATATGVDAATELKARTSDPLVVTVVGQTRTCKPDASECRYDIRLATKARGDATIEMTKDETTVADSFGLAVRDAVHLEPVVQATGPKQTRPGRSLVYVGESLTVLPYPTDDDGQRLVHHTPVTSLASSNTAAVTTDASNPTRATALALGSSTLTVSVQKTTATVEIDVVAR
jgi:hypothetical protein